MSDINERKITRYGVEYAIKAKERIFNPMNFMKLLLNKHRYTAKNFYYKNGTFIKKNISIHFEKAYWLEGVLYMKKCSGFFKNHKFQSKEVAYRPSKLSFKNILYSHEGKYYSSPTYSYILQKQNHNKP